MNKINVALVATLAACSVAFADATVQTFEGLDNTEGKWAPTTGWSTEAAVATNPEASDYPAIAEAGEAISAPANGFGVIGANPDHTDSSKVLSLNGGKATVTMPSSSSGIITSDLLVKVVHSSLDALSLGDFATPAPKLAIAVDKDGKFQAWTGGDSFSLLSNTPYAEGTWVRVTTLISNDCCRIALDGQLACNGAWLKLSSATAPSQLTVQSSSCIDDVVVKAEASDYVYDKYAAVNANGSEAKITNGSYSVPTNYLLANDKAAEADSVTEAVQNTYEQGVATDGTFAITEGSFDGSKVTLTFPGDWPADAYVVKYGNSPDKLNSTAPMSSSAKSGVSNTVVVDGMTDGMTGTVLYYKVARAQ
ncbi:MAG: hypothetical protein E7049_07775 [Lentisphaerae bacterium]|nr:hypothetical protein [Lentisphaerota bacterium]